MFLELVRLRPYELVRSSFFGSCFQMKQIFNRQRNSFEKLKAIERDHQLCPQQLFRWSRDHQVAQNQTGRVSQVVCVVIKLTCPGELLVLLSCF